MLNSTAVSIGMGTVLGFFSGLGVGGGSLLILWLTVVLKMDYAVARIVNLLFFLPSALIASIFRWKQGCLPTRKLPTAVIAGCIAAVICACLTQPSALSSLKKYFGALLILTGIRELRYKKKEPH